MSPQLCLGTAQFGLPYGITNSLGQVSEEEVKNLLTEAYNSGVSWLDTAQGYGNAEEVLGRTRSVDQHFQFINKLTGQNQINFTVNDSVQWDESLKRTFTNLGTNQLDALLLHNIADLKKPGSEYLKEWLIGLKNTGKVKQLGASIYKSTDLECVPKELLDIIQLPISLYDQRLLLDGTVARLKSKGCTIHARSLFLQGLLLTSHERWPEWVHQEDRAHHGRLEDTVHKNNSNLLEYALNFAKMQKDIDLIVLGISSSLELSQILSIWNQDYLWRGEDWNSWALNNPYLLDPRCWPKSKT